MDKKYVRDLLVKINFYWFKIKKFDEVKIEKKIVILHKKVSCLQIFTLNTSIRKNTE